MLSGGWSEVKRNCVTLTEGVSLLLEKRLGGDRGGLRGDRCARRAVKFNHNVRGVAGGLHRVENTHEVDFPLPQRAVAREILAAAEVLQVHMDRDRGKVLDDLGRVGAALLQLADIGGELEAL